MTPHCRTKSRLRSAFTLIEAVATIVILAAIGSLASNLILVSTDGYLQADTSAQLHAEASVGMDRLVRELRKVELDDDAEGVAPDIDSITPSSISWNDGCSLTLVGGDLMLAEGGGEPAVLLGDVENFAIQAFDEDNSAMPSALSGSECDAIRRLRLTVTLQRAGVIETLRTKLFIRATMAGAEEVD